MRHSFNVQKAIPKTVGIEQREREREREGEGEGETLSIHYIILTFCQVITVHQDIESSYFGLRFLSSGGMV